MNNKRGSKTNIRLPKLGVSLPKPRQPSLHKGYKPEETTNPSGISAQAHGIYSIDLKPLSEYKPGVKREIASLTKMMTLYCSLRLSRKFQINRQKCYFRITPNAASTRGTSAELESREWATIDDLLYGLMLPSGNDAAMVLAQNFGACLYYDRLGEAKLLMDLKSLDLTDDTWNIKIYTEQFAKYMNSTARELGLKQTNYVNPHGLDCPLRLDAFSTVEDQALLTKACWEDFDCMTVMSRLEYTGDLKTINGKEIEVRKQKWNNTHLLLGQQGYIGGKTGQTYHAGNCLTTVYRCELGSFIVVVLGCASKEQRFSETKQLIEKHIQLT